MKRAASSADSSGTAAAVRRRIEAAGERLWRLDDFHDLPFGAVARALSRLAAAGAITRLSKGTYHRSRPTVFGPSHPNPSAVEQLATRPAALFPAGIAAANRLGFTTQNLPRGELATTATSVHRKLLGDDVVVHTGRPAAWAQLSEMDAAFLDFLRRRGRTGELPPKDTLRRTLSLLADDGRFVRLASVANTEPPRVRALLGALGEQLARRHGGYAAAIARLRASLNPLSRFDFGVFADMPNAKAWWAKGRP